MYVCLNLKITKSLIILIKCRYPIMTRRFSLDMNDDNLLVSCHYPKRLCLLNFRLRRHVALKIVKSDKKCTEVAIEEIKMMKEVGFQLNIHNITFSPETLV